MFSSYEAAPYATPEIKTKAYSYNSSVSKETKIPEFSL